MRLTIYGAEIQRRKLKSLIVATNLYPVEVNDEFTSIGQFATTEYSGVYSPRLCLDDKREYQNASRDVLFFYIKTGTPEKLCYRQQRERYTVERELVDVPANTLRLGRVGMAKTNRVQIEFITL